MIENEWLRMKAKWNLSSIHLFVGDSYSGFRCFVARRDSKGFQASITEGLGDNWNEAIADCEENLRVGPIKASERIAAAKESRSVEKPASGSKPLLG